MQTEVRYWIIFVEGINLDGEKEVFPVTYCGKSIIWTYLMDTLQEDYELVDVKINGYNEISETEYHKASQYENNNI